MGNHSDDCEYCGNDLRGLMGGHALDCPEKRGSVMELTRRDKEELNRIAHRAEAVWGRPQQDQHSLNQRTQNIITDWVLTQLNGVSLKVRQAAFDYVLDQLTPESMRRRQEAPEEGKLLPSAPPYVPGPRQAVPEVPRATYGITKESLTIWQGHVPVLVVGIDRFPDLIAKLAQAMVDSQRPDGRGDPRDTSWMKELINGN